MRPIDLTGVTERDIDLLLVEEAMSSPTFLSWLLHRLELDPGGKLADVRHSVNTSSGESDIELDVLYPVGLTRLLLENKIDAPFQPQQAERYANRAASYRSSTNLLQVLTVLVAPDDYGSGSSDTMGFDRRLPYEAILEWYSGPAQLGDRAVYKCSLISSAIERGGTGWTLIPNDATTAYWLAYWHVAQSYARELNMPRPGIKPATSNFVFFQPSGLKSDVRLVHKLPYGKVDLQFAGMGDRLEEMKQAYPALPQDMTVVKAAKSASIRMKVPEIDLQAPLSLDQVHAGLDAAKKLMAFYTRHMQSINAT